MPDPVLWRLDDHTRAKHRVLRAYLDQWIPIMGQQAVKVHAAGSATPPRLLLVDGFAGPGRYVDGEPGSPLIMLDALASHVALSRLGSVKFIFLFIEQDERRVERLREEVAKVNLPPNAEVLIEYGKFEETFGDLVDRISPGHVLIPTFAFIDPFGYSAASMSLTGRLLDFPRSEALFFLPLSYLHRFVGRAGQEAALTSLFDTDEWRDAIPLSGDERRCCRRSYLAMVRQCWLSMVQQRLLVMGWPPWREVGLRAVVWPPWAWQLIA
jgi:three-Cys-motif partner protein